MLRRVLTLSILLALVSVTFGSAGLSADTKSVADYDLKALAIVVNRDSSDITVIDPVTDTIIKRIPLGEYTNAHMAMLNHDGKKLIISATGRDRFLVVDLVTGKVEHTIMTGKAPEHFDATPDGRRAFVGNMEDSTVYVSSLGAHEVAVLDATSGRMIKRLAVGDVGRVAARDPQRYLSEIKGIVNPTLTKDGAFAYAADGDAGVVAIIDTKADKIVKTLKVGGQPWRAYNSPDGRWMLVPNNGDSTVSVIDTTSQKVVAQLIAGSDMTGINYALDGSKAYVISRGDSTVYVFDMKTFGLVTRLKLTQGTANLALETAATTADGTKIYLASSTNDSVYVIDAWTDQVKQITDVGCYPWGVSILAAASPNYCH